MFCWKVEIVNKGRLQSVLVETKKGSLLNSLPALSIDYNKMQFVELHRPMVVGYTLYSLGGKLV